jgi:hypothetical protein
MPSTRDASVEPAEPGYRMQPLGYGTPVPRPHMANPHPRSSIPQAAAE